MNYVVNILGGFRLTRANGDQCFVRKPVQRLVARLALSERAERRCVLAAAMWPELREQRALANLRSLLWRCNVELPGLIETHGIAVRLPTTITVDFLDHGASDPDLFQDLLPDWTDEWIELPRYLHRQTRMEVIEERARCLAAADALDPALDLMRRLVAQEPHRESACRLLASLLRSVHRDRAAEEVEADYLRTVNAALRIDRTAALAAA